MAAIDDLISQIQDAELRDRIQKEVNKLSKQKKFGLVFEEHMPECTPLYDMPIKRGCKVMLRDNKEDKSIYVVIKIEEDKAICTKRDNQGELFTFSIPDIVRVAEFGESIYPYLKPLDAVCNAPDSELWHTLIEADNYHALQLLEYLYAGKVDCIYIDPPYNTGAKDWKYNNDYVDGSDTYRHSKWLSMMEKRLILAKRLLNPRDSVMVVTIDEKEYHHLACLLEEIFPSARIQMVTCMTNKKGSTRAGAFCRRDEYIYFVFIGEASITKNSDDMISSSDAKKVETKAIWNSLLRRGADGSSRKENPNLFYPFFISKETGAIIKIGDPLPVDQDRNTIEVPQGAVPGWPIRSDNSEGRWQVSAENARQMVKNGAMKAGKHNAVTNGVAINYLKKGQLEDLEKGILQQKGIDENGAGIFEYVQQSLVSAEPGTIWVRDSHDASIYGSTLLRTVIPGRRFPFPKSLYAVHDTIRFLVSNKPQALILDFFAGSGTTLHAVNLLNAEDGGSRRCILVTNNEVSESESKELTQKGFRPGDKEWDDYGIARYITWPRTVCSIEGHDIEGSALKGNYWGSELAMGDGFKSNAAFFQLAFLDKTAVSLGMQFREMLPTLWMKAGCVGKCPVVEGSTIPDMLILPKNRFAILVNENAFAAFEEELPQYSEIQTVFLATDYDVNYRAMAKNLNVEQTYQLYRDYLDHFRLNRGRN